MCVGMVFHTVFIQKKMQKDELSSRVNYEKPFYHRKTCKKMN